LLRFGLKDVSELPSMEEFEKMAVSELEEADITEPESSSGEAAAADAVEFIPDLSTETNIETNGTGANHEAEAAAQSPQTASDASGIKVE
jgi:segregation and condensation protein B